MRGSKGVILPQSHTARSLGCFVLFFSFFFFKGRQGSGGYPSQEIKAKMSLYQRKLSSSPYSLTMYPKGGHANDRTIVLDVVLDRSWRED